MAVIDCSLGQWAPKADRAVRQCELPLDASAMRREDSPGGLFPTLSGFVAVTPLRLL